MIDVHIACTADLLSWQQVVINFFGQIENICILLLGSWQKAGNIFSSMGFE